MLIRRTLVVAAVALALAAAALRGQAPPWRAVALTFDDLPGVLAHPTVEALVDVNRRLLATVRISGASAIGFVNEGEIDVSGERPARAAILQAWIDAGMGLGNHGFAHLAFDDTPLADYEANLLRGERITRPLVEARGKPLVWYRHPFNQTGPTLDDKTKFEDFAREHGYRIAPFTIESSDYLFARHYEKALDAGNRPRADAVMADYLDFQDAKVRWAEAFSIETFGREIPQVLLCHVNRLNADAMPELLRRLRARGYSFVSLDDAVKDAAYATPDLYVARNGVSWLHRWRVALRVPPRLDGEPDPPGWVLGQ